MPINTMGDLASGSVLDLGLGQDTVDQLKQQENERKKKKRLGVANSNPGAYGDPSASLLSRQLFGIQ